MVRQLLSVGLAAWVLLVAGVAAQQAGAPVAQRDAMATLAYMVGTWEGEGWIDLGGGQRGAFRGTEVIQSRLNGTALLVEGSFSARIPGVANEVPVHSTIGVISFVPQTQRYRFSTWLATGLSGDGELVLEPNGWHWGFDTQAGPVRYTMRLTDAGEWFEIGERSSDGGKTW